MGRPIGPALAGLLICIFLPAASRADQAPATGELRAFLPREARLVAHGVDRSPTFRQLVADIDRSDVIVYVHFARSLRRKIGGGLQFLGTTASARLLRVVLNHNLRDQDAIAILGHELQHALEVAAAPDIRTVQTFDRYYRTQGVRGAYVMTYDSKAARLAGTQIRRELAD